MSILKRGAAGTEVASLVADLTAIGFPPSVNPGNVFNEEVEKAIRSFQSQAIGPDGLPLVIDGEVGPLTRFAIEIYLGRHTPPPLGTLPIPTTGGRPGSASQSGWNALQIAKRELAAGAGEQGGDNLGPDVMKFHAVTGASAGDSWCASFVSYCFQQGNPGAMPYRPTAGARDTLEAFRKKGWAFQANFSSPPEPGDIIVWWRGAISGWKGHIGLVSGYENGLIHTIEGNRGAFPSKVSAFHYKLGKVDRLLGFGRAQP